MWGEAAQAMARTAGQDRTEDRAVRAGQIRLEQSRAEQSRAEQSRG